MSCNTPIMRTVFDSATVQEVAAGGVINMPEVTSNSSCLTSSGGTASIRKQDDYNVSANVTAVATAIGPVEIQLYRNGSPVPGAHAIGQAAAVGDNVPLSFSTPITVECCGTETLTLRAITATTVRIANMVIEGVQ